jgi:hypothetical protein
LSVQCSMPALHWGQAIRNFPLRPKALRSCIYVTARLNSDAVVYSVSGQLSNLATSITSFVSLIASANCQQSFGPTILSPRIRSLTCRYPVSGAKCHVVLDVIEWLQFINLFPEDLAMGDTTWHAFGSPPALVRGDDFLIYHTMVPIHCTS